MERSTNMTTSLKTLNLEELTLVAGGISTEKEIIEDNVSGEDTTSEGGSPEPGTGDRDIGYFG